MEYGIQNKLWALAENIARTIETPEHLRAREKAAQAEAETLADTDENTMEAESIQHSPVLQEAVGDDHGHDPESENAEESILLEVGEELDELAAKCVGAISLMLRSPEATDALAMANRHNGLSILLELATATQGR